jgi:hypothetical protein
VTAEFAAALPAALLCLALCVGAVQAVAQQSRLVGEAASEARRLGRGEALSGSAGELSGASRPGEVRRHVRSEGGMVCVALSAASEAAGLGRLGVTVSAEQCAVDERVAGEQGIGGEAVRGESSG